MRLNLANDSIEQQISSIIRDLDELKTRQFTSQNSGMLGRIVGATDKDDYGDIVTLSGDFTGPNPTSHIPCPATPSPSHYNSIYCTQKFYTQHNKPAVLVPFVKLAVDEDGLYGESEFTLVGYRFMFLMDIYNASNVKVGEANIIQDLGDYLQPKYASDTPYAWETVITYTSTVAFKLSYQLLARSSDRAGGETEMEGLFF